MLGWVRWVYKIEFQHRGHPHIHAAKFLGKHGHDLYKIFKNDGTNLDDIKDEIEKMVDEKVKEKLEILTQRSRIFIEKMNG